jgi:hypothetical protein
MGLNASSDEFCARTDQALHGIKGIKKLVDDILVSAECETGLYAEDQGSSGEVPRTRDNHLQEKVARWDKKLKFAGYIVSAQGVRPDPEKVQAIKEFPPPKDATGVRSFLGLANQLGAFLPDLAHATVLMRQLIKKGVAFQWLEMHEEEFKKAKDILTSPANVC